MAEYPEHEKLKALDGANQTVGSFIEWLHENGYSICRYEVNDREYDDDGDIIMYGTEGYWPTTKPTEQLIADHFGIDRKKLDAEKDAMIRDMIKRRRQRKAANFRILPDEDT